MEIISTTFSALSTIGLNGYARITEHCIVFRNQLEEFDPSQMDIKIFII